MRRYLSNVHPALLLLMTASTLQLACTGPRVIGNIPPSTFQFHNVVPHAEPGEGGWKVARVLVLLGKLSMTFPEAASCDIEVGVPEFNWQGLITDEKAQSAAALAADEAARMVLNERLPTAVLCNDFRTKMQFFMNNEEQLEFISGSRVSRFRPWGIEIEPRTFP